MSSLISKLGIWQDVSRYCSSVRLLKYEIRDTLIIRAYFFFTFFVHILEIIHTAKAGGKTYNAQKNIPNYKWQCRRRDEINQKSKLCYQQKVSSSAPDFSLSLFLRLIKFRITDHKIIDDTRKKKKKQHEATVARIMLGR